ncbi:MAG TPA: universal stress protein [Vicinamibacterales bacterium]|nr:universal stress protein [Vicinamibacterales bacterium]
MAIQSVLAAVDFGEASARAVAVAGTIADRCHAALRLLHAESAEAPPYFTSEQLDDLERQRQAMETQAERFLADFGRRHTAAPFTATIERRAAIDAILDASAGADLIVMGTHGRHGPKRWWLGSVSERVLRDVNRPLLVVRAADGDRAATTPEHLFDRTLVHAAAPIAGERALAFARDLAAHFGGTVTDSRHGLIEPELERWHATLLVAAVPEPRAAAWTSNYGEPLVRFCTVPILFVPEFTMRGSR